jgi:hemerythrin-like domain-containing protein
MNAMPVTLDGFAVLDDCHQRTLSILDLLDELVTRLEQGGADEQARAMAAEILGFFSTTARAHHEDEERHVFPPLLASGDAQLVQDVLRLQQDHGWMDVDWHELEPLLAAVAAGQSGYDLDALREGSAVFRKLSQDHILLEETCIYPQARDRLGNAQRQEMGREMAARRRRAHSAA